MTVPAQRVVAVKKTGLEFYRRTLALVVVLALPASAQDAGIVLDAPLAERYADGSLLFNPAGAKTLDLELKRLQGVERLHKGESWITVVAISSGVGVVVGVLATTAAFFLKSVAPAAPSSPPTSSP